MKKVLITTIALAAIGVAVRANKNEKYFSIEIGELSDEEARRFNLGKYAF